MRRSNACLFACCLVALLPAPLFDGDKKITNARMTVRHNGVVIHDNVGVQKITPGGPQKEEKPVGPLHLQNHGNPVRYCNIWVLPTS